MINERIGGLVNLVHCVADMVFFSPYPTDLGTLNNNGRLIPSPATMIRIGQLER